MELDEAMKLLGALERERVAYVLVGSMGMAVHGVVGERFRYADLEWQEVDVDGISVRVATPLTLYRMKRDTIRPRDKADAAELRRRFDLEED